MFIFCLGLSQRHSEAPAANPGTGVPNRTTTGTSPRGVNSRTGGATTAAGRQPQI